MGGQDSFIMRELEDAEVDFGEDGEDAVADVGNNNADLYTTTYTYTQPPIRRVQMHLINAS